MPVVTVDNSTVNGSTVNGSTIDDWTELGGAIRERRAAAGLTLVGLAGLVDLSQSFLSQIENGRARPSLMSLHRIAEALGTTPQALFGGAADSDTGPVVVRAGEVRVIDVGVDAGTTGSQSACRLLLAGDAPFHVLEFDGLPDEFMDYFVHEGFEATYVISGNVEIDVAGTVTALGCGDSISYSSRLAHRLRSTGRRRAKVLLIETKVERVQDSDAAEHSALAGTRVRPVRGIDGMIQSEVNSQ